MVICGLSEPFVDPVWKQVVNLGEPLDALPTERLKQDQPSLKWSERLIQRSLCRQPDVLAGALGVTTPKDVFALREVKHIDLYLLVDKALHLLEVKKPKDSATLKDAGNR